MSYIREEIGKDLGKKSGASVEHWGKGNFPPKWRDHENLARILVKRGKMDRDWLVGFMQHGNHPAPMNLVDELFPDEAEQTPVESDIRPIFLLPTRDLPDAATLPTGSHMPLSQNPHFVGRKQDLLALANHFQENHVTAVTQAHIAAAAGLGGVGKTQLASEFVHRYGQFFLGGVFWLSFEDPEAVPSQIAACGGTGAMNLSPVFWDLPLKDQVKRVRQEWQSPVPRLLVFDNCEDEDLLAEWLPTTGGCRILVTTRRGEWDSALGVQTLPLGALYRHESVDLLKRLSKVDDLVILDKIAAELGDLPLALHLAGKYLKKKKRTVSPEAYLAQLRDPNLLDHPSFAPDKKLYSPTGHVQNVARTFALSYDQLDLDDGIDQIAQALLVRAANFAPGEPIWYQLLCQTVKPLVQEDQLEELAEEGFTRLIDLGLVEFEEKEDVFRMHRLVARFVRQVAAEAVQDSLESVEQIVFEELSTINKSGYPVPLLSWNLHLRSVTENAAERQSEQSAWLLNLAGEHFRQMGDYQGAKGYFKRALDSWQATAGDDSELTAEGHMNYGKILRDLGQLDEAEPHLKRCLDCRLELLGEMHPQTAEAYNEYGRWLLRRKATHKLAKTHFEKAVEISKDSLGTFHASTADYLNNLGICLSNLNKLSVAHKILLEALEIRQKTFGENNSRTALSLNNLGYILRSLGQLNDAKEFYEKSLKVREHIYGQNHPDVAESLNNLGNLFFAQKQYLSAMTILTRAQKIYENTLGTEHLKLAYVLHNLGEVSLENNNRTSAQEYLQKAYEIRLKNLGLNNPLTLKSFEKLEKINLT